MDSSACSGDGASLRFGIVWREIVTVGWRKHNAFATGAGAPLSWRIFVVATSATGRVPRWHRRNSRVLGSSTQIAAADFFFPPPGQPSFVCGQPVPAPGARAIVERFGSLKRGFPAIQRITNPQTWEGWSRRLAERGFCLKGHRLVRRNGPDLPAVEEKSQDQQS
jgi:hypothetical protein